MTRLTPGFGTTAGGESVEVTGTGFANGAANQVAGVQVGAWHAAAGAIHVLGADRADGRDAARARHVAGWRAGLPGRRRAGRR